MPRKKKENGQPEVEGMEKVEVKEEDATLGESTRRKRLDADFSTDVIKMTVVDGVKGQMEFNVNDLPEDIKHQAMIFGVYKKLGTQGAMSNKTGVEAEEAVEAQWETLMKGEWKVRATGGAKKSVSVKSLVSRLENLSEADRKVAEESLTALGITLPK